MSDPRELILERLKAIAADVPGVLLAGRNMLEVAESKTPAVMILEGDEEVSPTHSEVRQRPMTPMPMVMVPELCIIGNETAANLGETLNAVRAELIKAVTTDATLAAILGSNGRVVYRGSVTDLGIGRAMLGRMALRFAISYVLKPEQL